MKKILLIIFIVSSFSSFSQTFTRHLDQFEELIVARGVQATLIKSNSDELSFEVHGLSKDDIIVDQDRGVLTIKVRTKSLWEAMQENDWWVRVTIPYQNLVAIDASTGAEITAKNTIETDDLLIDVSMGATVNLEIKANRLSVDSTMGGVVNLQGNTQNLNVDVSMGAIIKAAELESKYVKVKSSMGSVVSVYCTSEFDGSASMGAQINVKGNPKKWFENTSMGGEIDDY